MEWLPAAMLMYVLEKLKAIYVSGQIKCYVSLPISSSMSFSQKDTNISQVFIRDYILLTHFVYMIILFINSIKRKQITKRKINDPIVSLTSIVS